MTTRPSRQRNNTDSVSSLEWQRGRLQITVPPFSHPPMEWIDEASARVLRASRCGGGFLGM